MPRMLFEKTGNAVWMSHLDLMRVFQRAFKRAGLPLTHSKGFNPRPSVSIALPLSVGIESVCELLDFELDGVSVPNDDVKDRLNQSLVAGVRVRKVYDQSDKIKNIAYLDCRLTMKYDRGVPSDAVEKIRTLFSVEELLVEKKSKNGSQDQNIMPMIRGFAVSKQDDNTVLIDARICCQNPSLNPMQLNAAVERYLPEYKADYVKCCRLEIIDVKENIFR